MPFQRLLKCSVCKKEKSEDSFTHKSTTKRGRSYSCRDCEGKQRREWRAETGNMKGYNLSSRYGLTWQAYLNMVTSQSSGCAICGSFLFSSERNSHVDHDHKTGKVRAILCRKCNMALGLMDEDVEIVLKMANYIVQHMKNHQIE